MKSIPFGTATVAACILIFSSTALPCSVNVAPGGPQPNTLDWTKMMVTNSELILRVTAVEYAIPPEGSSRWSSGMPDSKVRFSVAEVVKGTYSSKEIILAGYLSDRDEGNPGPAPYEGPRQSALTGSCFTHTYRKGGAFLLVLKTNINPGVGPSSSNDEYTVNTLSFAPVNEQLHSSNDPWLLWVRDQVKK